MFRRRALTAAALAATAIAAGCGDSDGKAPAGRLDARSLVAQPHDVGGLRVVQGSWTTLGGDGVYILSDVLGAQRVPAGIAFLATYSGVAGSALGKDVDALAIVLPDEAAAGRMLAATSRVEGFIGDAGDAHPSAAEPPGSADSAVGGTAPHGAVSPGPVALVAWTKGPLYGYVTATGPGARALVARIAAAQEARFERALDGDGLGFDALLRPDVRIAHSPFPARTGRTIHSGSPAPRIEREGRYTLEDLAGGPLTFFPAAGQDGIQFPVLLALPESPRGRWLWRITTHVLVTLSPKARLGRAQIYPHIANTGAPGAQFIVARNLSDGDMVLIEETKHTTSATSIEVRMSAMMGGSPSPRQRALVGFAFGYSGAERAFESVTVLPDSAIEVFDDPAKIGAYAMETDVSKAFP